MPVFVMVLNDAVTGVATAFLLTEEYIIKFAVPFGTETDKVCVVTYEDCVLGPAIVHRQSGMVLP